MIDLFDKASLFASYVSDVVLRFLLVRPRNISVSVDYRCVLKSIIASKYLAYRDKV